MKLEGAGSVLVVGVDVGASHHLPAQTDEVAGQAAARGATAMLSVGVAPALTNARPPRL